MTGIADLYLYLKRPYSKNRRKRLFAHFTDQGRDQVAKVVVLSWKRTGSNLLCGILHNHPEICMHNELFNPIDIFTYHPNTLLFDEDLSDASWSTLTRDLMPFDFLEHIWNPSTVWKIRPFAKVVGFKSFPEHWKDTHNEYCFQQNIMQDLRVKKIILYREDELAVYVSMKRAETTGHYMTHTYPPELKIRVDPAVFQIFVNNYRHTFRDQYQSPMATTDTFWITYDELVDIVASPSVETNKILPKLWNFLGVDPSVPLRTLRETVKQADSGEDLSTVISNYDELEFCYRHSDVTHFAKKRNAQLGNSKLLHAGNAFQPESTTKESSWSILLPICSRPRSKQKTTVHMTASEADQKNRFNSNRFIDLALSSQHDDCQKIDSEACWQMLEEFGQSLKETMTVQQMENTECIVGIDKDDLIYQGDDARKRICALLPCKTLFFEIKPVMYGHVCKIWNFLASKASNDFIVLLGDDIKVYDQDWQGRVVQKFDEIADQEGMPFGAACVGLNDLSFPGFPTFPVVHRWHMNQFGSLLPRQFANQGGDPYLYELYSRFNAAAFCVNCRVKNCIGGDGDARYKKHQINWRCQILNMGIRKLKESLGPPKGVVLDVVVPSYRVDNDDFLRKIVQVRASRKMYVRFWLVVDNPLEHHVQSVKDLAKELNTEQLLTAGNYYITVIHYSENRGASYARNTGYNYSTADWVLFLDDDVIPQSEILDAYYGAIQRYPDGKVFVGQTELPEACGLWTQMLRTCNVGYFYSVAKIMVHPSWGVTANLMVRGSRFNSTIQFKDIYPKTGGGEDIDFVYQFKARYKVLERRVTVGVPEAVVKHPWWNSGNPCYGQISGWAIGDSLCITEWPNKTFLAFPNWVEYIAFVLFPLTMITGKIMVGTTTIVAVVVLEHFIKIARYLSSAREVTTSDNFFYDMFVALGAGSVLSAQELTRTIMLIRRGSVYSICRRVDWFDGQKETIKLDVQLGSLVRFLVTLTLTYVVFSLSGDIENGIFINILTGGTSPMGYSL
mmetsp:Transcript_12923/g.27249  ORF Transcript_12923/g.27249 Transcript_12923/m.27249 type:complete len:1014 (+) Transcript_12923:733-3774(+)|eukprot:CAMPEP_0168183540 /NCGR_PEP_ID=MMETSP0139_2-20121125/12627_1 /TAXON_ID=44445 /ORGANISM="Pseudo-nitzschia australis, Strain 10249 10 AB" /LENGTH=1013 /DNA_ID=CAMNT_0008104835 /DNA_START=230 /DNA_END=3271 /DNA_ORIENTATION=+